MATEVLHPHDPLARSLRRRPHNRSNPNTRQRRRREVTKPPPDLSVFGTGRIGPEPAAVPKPYAGSGFSVSSPAPSSLPMPTFPSRKLDEGGAINHSATRDLLRILRLQ